jgi:hypothetical protein
MSASEIPAVPYRQIRASFDEHTITVYQAYSASIAKAAVSSQKLHASPDFSFTRMTWIKPSWCWMMYRSGYSTKDSRQSHILALKMTHENFRNLLSHAAVTHGTGLTDEEKAKPVRVQWDPERGPGLEVLPYRSIQIGIGQSLGKQWVEGWIESIEDVTEKALLLKEEAAKGQVGKDWGRLVEIDERVYEVPGDIRGILKMD